MARVSKRKQPTREEQPLKEALKIAGKVFDDKTVEVLLHFLNSAVFKSLDYPVSQGKEAIVFRASAYGGKFLAVKVFKYETSSFHKMMDYVVGDPRFNIAQVKGSKRSFVKLWARKEFSNLKSCANAGVRVPRPMHARDNVVVMEFIGVDGVPCALLEDVVVENPEELFGKIREFMRLAYRAGIVHADLSPFNVIMFGDEPVFIDWAQGVSVQHPKANDFLHKDCENMAKFFKKLDVDVETDSLYEFVTH